MKSALALSVASISLACACATPPRDAAADNARAAATACSGLSGQDVASAMQTLQPNIQSVETKYEAVSYPKGSPEQRLAGAIVYVRAAPGETAEWLTRVMSCRAARAVGGASVRTTSTDAGYAVMIEAKDDAAARAIVKSSQELASAR